MKNLIMWALSFFIVVVLSVVTLLTEEIRNVVG